MSPLSTRAQAHDALRRAIEIDRGTLAIARESNETLAVQGQKIREITHNIETIDRNLDKADRTAGKINSCCGRGFWHWLKRKLCCMDGSAGAIRESHEDELRRAETAAHREPIFVPAAAEPAPATDSFDPELDIISRQIAELKEDALRKRAELNLQNQMLNVANQQAAATHAHAKRVETYVGRIG